MIGEERKIDLRGKINVRKDRALVRVDSTLGGQDRLFALLDAEPDRDRFDLKADYVAPRGGLLAALAGMKGGARLRIAGKGSWQRWDGALLADQGDARLAALRLGNRAGKLTALGQVWPGDNLSGMARRAAADGISLDVSGTLSKSVWNGRIAALSKALQIVAIGKVDLGDGAFEAMKVQAAMFDPALVGGDIALEKATAVATLDGTLSQLTIDHAISAERLVVSGVAIERPATKGIARHDGSRWILPVDLAASRVVTGEAALDPYLTDARIRGELRIAGSQVSADRLALIVPGIAARAALRGDLERGSFGLAGPIAARGVKLADMGQADAEARAVVRFGSGIPLFATGSLSGRMTRIDNQTLATIAGNNIRLTGSFALGAQMPLLFERAELSASKLSLKASGRRLADGRTSLSGSGRHSEYGTFRIDTTFGADGPRAALLFDDPFPSVGLRHVSVALTPIPEGFRLETRGSTPLGPFNGTLGLFARPGAPVRLEVERMEVWKTAITGGMTIGKDGLNGKLALSGGGISGTVGLAPSGRSQGVAIELNASNARFGGETPVTIASGKIEASGSLARDATTLSGNLFGQGIGYGNLFLGRVSANARLVDGRGQVTASLAGRRGSRFDLQLQGDAAPGRMALIAQGNFAGQRIALPRPAVLTREASGWRLAPTQIVFGKGRAVASGRFGFDELELQLALSQMPLSAADAIIADLGLGGVASGMVEYRHPRGGPPSGSARLQVQGLTRAGLVLVSRPVDASIAATLTGSLFETRAVLRDGGAVRGRVQARISGIPGTGPLISRLRAGSLFAQLRYDGQAEALWRLVAVEAIDLTGPVSLAADASGSLSSPRIAGSLSSSALRLQSAITGTDISGIAVKGRFDGAKLDLDAFSGRAANGGQVAGSGSFDLSGIGVRGPGIDLRLAARGAELVSRPDMAAVVSGPLRIVSDGHTGTIAGRVAIVSARWRLGRAAAAEDVPEIRTIEINRRADVAPDHRIRTAWSYMIDAAGARGIQVRGLGVDSEWSARLRLRGPTNALAIYGQAELVRGGYEFAGRRFEMRRGRIDFDGSSPPNPRLDILAEAQVTGLNARLSIAGTSLRPAITFASTPAMPEEEVLSRLLFGNSITQISAPEALQLGSALAALRSGGGLDPINKLRAAVGLDRLRIVGADAVIGRSTGVAAGKYIGRRLYAEIVTDGRGYSATELEFRVTNWLSLLGSISTIGREGLNVKVSKDY